MHITDFLVIGGGIIGINVARKLKQRFSSASVTVIEKEADSDVHASGRNSGVLHAGFYYTSDSLKARFTKEGNRLLTEFCESYEIPINKCGKLVVAINEAEDKVLDELLKRAKKNDVSLEEINVEDVHRIEPRAKTYRRALYSPTTASVDPRMVISLMKREIQREGVCIQYDAGYLGKVNNKIKTTKGLYQAGYVINTAGLYADKIANGFGFSQNYAILPFKGLYLKSEEPAGAYRTNIYPVPDLKNPFLGVHFTVQVDGRVKIGPTAIPALWREQYARLSNFKLQEFIDITFRSIGLLMKSDFDFRRLAFCEVMKYSRRHMVQLAQTLVPDTPVDAFKQWANPGIRAQLVDLRQRKLEMDFVLEGDDKSMHVLNAVSPGWTCSIPFSQYIVDHVCQKLS